MIYTQQSYIQDISLFKKTGFIVSFRIQVHLTFKTLKTHLDALVEPI